MGIKIPSCKTYNVTRKVIPETSWDLSSAIAYHTIAYFVVFKAYNEDYWYPKYGEGYWVGCGPVAAALVFRYWGLINNGYARCLPNLFSYELLEKIHEEAHTSFDGGTTDFDLIEGIEKTAQYYGMKFNAEFTVRVPSFFEDEINDNRIAIMGVVNDPEWEDHFVTVYGYQIDHRRETCCQIDWICPDHHYVRVILGWPLWRTVCEYYDGEYKCKTEMVDIELATRSMGPWYKDLTTIITGIQVIAKKPCSSGGGGGGGGGGGCSMGNLNIMSGIFIIVVFAFIMFKQRYKKCSTGKDC